MVILPRSLPELGVTGRYICSVTPAALASSIMEAARAVVSARGHDISVVPADAGLERTRNPRHGDYTSPVALRVASRTGDQPKELAQAIVARLLTDQTVRYADQTVRYEAAGPGFVNARLPLPATDRLARIVLSQGRAYGRSRELAGDRIERGPALTDSEGRCGLVEVQAYLVRRAAERILAAAGGGASAVAAPDRAADPGDAPDQDCPSSPAFDELVAAVGPDAARYYLIRSQPPAADVGAVDAIARHVPTNPVYFVRYMAACAAAAVRNAHALGVEFGVNDEPGRLRHENELALVTALGDYPWVVKTAAELRIPHRVARYLEDLAVIYHDFSDRCPFLPKGDEPVSDQMRVRSRLHAATRVVFANGLDLLGIQAPMRM